MRGVSVLLCVCALALAVASASGSVDHPGYQPALLAKISREVFGPRWRSAFCITRYESTYGVNFVNGDQYSPWQIEVSAHPWVNARRLLTDWVYAARVAYRISDGGTDWGAWSTHAKCGV